MRRWLTLIFYVLAGFPVALLLDYLYAVLGAKLTAITPFYLLFLSPFYSFGIGLLVVLAAWRLAPPRIKHFRWLFRYPPLLVAPAIGVVLGGAAIEVYHYRHAGNRLIWPVAAVASVILAFVSLYVVAILAETISAWKQRKRSTVANNQVGTIDLSTLSFDNLKSWLRNDSPTPCEADLIDRSPSIDRVWRALEKRRSGEDGMPFNHTIVVQGPFGAGKTTLVDRIEQRSKAHPECGYVFVKVTCWGFSSARAREHVLEQVVTVLGRHVDTTALRSMPKEYFDAISDVNNYAKTFVTVLGAKRTAALEQLRRLTPILKAIGKYLVIVIEDTDRNGLDFNQKDIEALLYSLRQVERVSFILTAGSLSEIDFPKIAEHIEFLPSIPRDISLRLIDMVRDYCRSNWHYVDPERIRRLTSDQKHWTRSKRPQSLVEEARVGDMTADLIVTAYPYWPSALTLLITTPRQLKSVLNTVLSRWELLHGEVDLDEFLILTVLRLCASEVFSFIAVHRQGLQLLGASVATDSSRQVISGQQSVLKRTWQKVIRNAQFDTNAASVLLTELFPATASITGVDNRAQRGRVQTVSSKEGPDYFARIGNEAIDQKELRDQIVLSAIERIDSQPTGLADLAKQMLEKHQFCDGILFFDNLTDELSCQEIFAIGSIVIDATLTFTSTKANSSAYDAVNAWVRRKCAGNESERNWIVQQIEKLFEIGLTPVMTFYFDFADRSSVDTVIAARETLYQLANTKYAASNSDAIASSMYADWPYTLSYLMRATRNIQEPGYRTQPSDWVHLGESLLQNLEQHPIVVAPQIFVAFGEWQNGRPESYHFDEAWIQGVFAERSGLLYSLLARGASISGSFDKKFALILPGAIDEAKFKAGEALTDDEEG